MFAVASRSAVSLRSSASRTTTPVRSARAVRAVSKRTLRVSASGDMIEIAPGVEFNKIAREWRCKWSPEDEKTSLVEAQKVRHLKPSQEGDARVS